jgi:hypothetical protein
MAILFHIYKVASLSYNGNSERLINETLLSGDDKQTSEDRKSLIMIIDNDDPNKNPNSQRVPA